MKRRLWRAAGVLLGLVFTSCAVQPSNPLVAPKKFAEIYADLQILAAEDSTLTTRADSLLLARGFSRPQFDEAVRYYNTHAEAWAQVVQHSITRLDSLANEQAEQDTSAAAREKNLNPKQ